MNTVNKSDKLKVIILNKPFLGGWLDEKGNIGHEIIDYLLTDGGEHYIYNLPWGVCPSDIWVEGSSLKRTVGEKYVAEYVVLTSGKHGDTFTIEHVIELAEKLHRAKKNKDNDKFIKGQSEVESLIRERDIRYNGRLLSDIYSNDRYSLHLTFRAKRIYQAEKPIKVSGIDYNFQRNKGYLYEDEQPEDFDKVLSIINESIKNGQLREISLKKVKPEDIGIVDFDSDTFLNLIGKEDDEQVFTNILWSILRHGNLMERFCLRFNKKYKEFDKNGKFEVLKENSIIGGRLDVCADSGNQRIIIENKVYSGLNGRRSKDNETQLSQYYRWGKESEMEPLCFITLPEYRLSQVREEIREYDASMIDIYQIVTYGEIADFIENAGIDESYRYHYLLNQIVAAFRNHSYSEEQYYARKFLELSRN